MIRGDTFIVVSNIRIYANICLAKRCTYLLSNNFFIYHLLRGSKMLLTNLEQVPGKKIVQHFGLVQGNTIRAKHVGKDFLAGLKNIFGGELGAYTELLAESRQEATDRMIQQAISMGANAIVNVRYSTSSVAQGAAELYAYGTAVKVDL